MASPTVLNPNAPGVLRGTATIKCETYRHEHQEPPTTTVEYVTQNFDANLWSDFRGKIDNYMNILSGNCKVDDISMEDQRDPGKYPSAVAPQAKGQFPQECKDAFDPKPDPNEGWFASIVSACERALTRVGCAMKFSSSSDVASAHTVYTPSPGDHKPECHGTACYR